MPYKSVPTGYRYYHLFGLRIASQFRLRLQAEPEPASQRAVDVHIEWADIAEVARRIKAAGGSLARREALVTFISHDLRFLVIYGKRIYIQATDQANHELIEHYLLTMAFTVLLHQRNFLVLHASAIKAGKAALFLGHSGSGKSTLAYNLSRRYRVISDDLCPIWLDDGRATLQATYPYLRIDPHSAEHPPHALQARWRSSTTDDKHTLHLPPTEFDYDQHPVGALFILQASDQPDSVSTQPLPVKEAIERIHLYLFRANLIRLQDIKIPTFQKVMQLANCCPVYVLPRGQRVEHRVEMVTEILDGLG